MAVFAVAIVWLGIAPGAVLRHIQAPAERIVEQVQRGGAAVAVESDALR
jgi:NADH:ubiquinone oxidoreductase subunit 4 (subunit M)